MFDDIIKLLRKKEEDERTKSGFCHDWSNIPDQIVEIDLIKTKTDTVSFRRVQKSHQGLKEFRNIKRLFAYDVNDDFLKEISCLSGLTYLWAQTVTAEDLTPLTKLNSLEFLILRRVYKAKSFNFVVDMPVLRYLCLEWVKHLRNIEDIGAKKNLLSLGVEGATPVSATQIIDSLAPILDWECLESLYLTNTRVKDGNLRCLGKIKTLKILDTARFYPKSEFEALREAHPTLKCDWCDTYEIEKYLERIS